MMDYDETEVDEYEYADYYDVDDDYDLDEWANECYDGWPNYASYYQPPTRRELLTWRLQAWWHRIKHPLTTLRYWHHHNIERCETCGERNQNCTCIPF